MDTARVLRPLDEAAPSIDKLDNYHSTEELSSALQDTWQAVDRTLRGLLRADPAAPDDVRLSAMSAADLPHDRLITALRQRDLISLRLAGMIHELELAHRRAAETGVRASDADHAATVAAQLRSEVSALGDRPVAKVAHNVVETGAVEQPPRDVPKATVRNRKDLMRMAAIGGGVLLLILIAFLLLGRDSELEKGIAAFQGEQWQQAEQHLLEASKDEDDVTAQLYLARVYRSTRQYDRAAAVLRTAAQNHPNDDDLQRELGKLFLDLNRPQQAVERLKRAREIDQADQANWIWLIRAMRLAGDPASEQVLQEAPDEVRAALARSN